MLKIEIDFPSKELAESLSLALEKTKREGRVESRTYSRSNTLFMEVRYDDLVALRAFLNSQFRLLDLLINSQEVVLYD